MSIATRGGIGTSAGSLVAGWRDLDWVLLLTMLIMTGVGLSVLRGGGSPEVAAKQATFLFVALAGLFVAYSVHYRWINRVGTLLYSLNIVALVAVLVVGVRINGAKSWINMGPVNWQPSETMKLATIVVCAQWLALHTDKLDSWRSIVVPGAICGVPALMVLAQPDLGSAMLFFLIFLAMLLVAGAPLGHMALLLGGAFLGAVSSYPLLKPYQRARLISFLNPEADALGSGYNVVQSKVAIGNGGLFGQGFGGGSQCVHGFLPEHNTDFIFANAVEQLGLVGALVILLGFLVIFLRMIRALDAARDRFGGLVVTGIAAMYAGHVVENIGMNMGLLPVTGIPLPFMSYGGTFLVTTYLAMGVVLNVASRRYTFVGG